jgi:histidine triad (HIT) family protein
MKDCIFCRIINKEIKAEIKYEDEYVVAFNDIEPMAPHHILVIPKEHIETTNELNDDNFDIISKLIHTAVVIAKKNNISSYRMVMNCNEDAGQSVFHIHLHLLGGRKMSWPPG